LRRYLVSFLIIEISIFTSYNPAVTNFKKICFQVAAQYKLLKPLSTDLILLNNNKKVVRPI